MAQGCLPLRHGGLVAVLQRRARQRAAVAGKAAQVSPSGSLVLPLSLPVSPSLLPTVLFTCRWEANAGQLLELFSAQGVVAEAVAAPRQASLVSIGYAPGLSEGGSAGGTMWVQRAGWCDPDSRLTPCDLPRLSLRAIEPVTTTRVVPSAALRRSVLDAAAASCGLRGLAQQPGAPSAPFAVPTQVVASPSDARWVAAPGRYLVTRKCDGTRHLLLAAEAGSTYLLNRAGTLYQFPLAAGSPALPAGWPGWCCLAWTAARSRTRCWSARSGAGWPPPPPPARLPSKRPKRSGRRKMRHCSSAGAGIWSIWSAMRPAGTQTTSRTASPAAAMAVSRRIGRGLRAPAQDVLP